jgi:uncharacterized membrane protein
MAFCSNCGAALAEGARFCAQCGREPGSALPLDPGYTPGAAAGGLSPNVAGLLCYVAGIITGVVFLILEPYNHDPFIRFHAFQSILFSGVVFVVSIALRFVPVIGAALYLGMWPAVVVIWVLLMVQAARGKEWKLPIIGELAETGAG